MLSVFAAFIRTATMTEDRHSAALPAAAAPEETGGRLWDVPRHWLRPAPAVMREG